MYYTHYGDDQFLAGDILRVGLHEGLYVGKGWVIHADKTVGVTYATFTEFCVGGVPEIASRAGSRDEALQRIHAAESALGTPYNLLNANCQHLTSFAKDGVPASRTVRSIVTVAALAWLFGRGDDETGSPGRRR